MPATTSDQELAPVAFTQSNSDQGAAPAASSMAIFDTTVSLDTTLGPAEEAELLRRMADLPQELYLMIQDCAFKAHISSTAPKESDMTDPAGRAQHISHLKILQLDRVTRAKYADLFYGLRTFTFQSLYFERYSILKAISRRIHKWLSSIPDAHRTAIGSLIAFVGVHTLPCKRYDMRNGNTIEREFRDIARKPVQEYFGRGVAKKVSVRFAVVAGGEHWQDLLFYHKF